MSASIGQRPDSFAPRNSNPYISKVGAHTIELVRCFRLPNSCLPAICGQDGSSTSSLKRAAPNRFSWHRSSGQLTEIFNIVAASRDAAIASVRDACKASRLLLSCEVDDKIPKRRRASRLRRISRPTNWLQHWPESPRQPSPTESFRPKSFAFLLTSPDTVWAHRSSVAMYRP